MSDKAKIIKFTETIVKIVIVLLGIWILYKKIIQNQNVTQVWNDIKISFTDKNQFILMIAAFLLVTVNILLEALKWKIQVKPIEDISLGKSYISIFTGMTAGMFFPNRMGNFLGRIFILEKVDRIKAAMVTIVGGMAQMIATVCIGLLAIILYVKKNYVLIGILSVLIIITLLLLYFNIHLLNYFQFLIPKKFKEKTEEYFKVFSLYDKKELLKILLLISTIISFIPSINWLNLKPETTSILFGYNNFWQLSANLDYFARHANSPFIHFWYIGIFLQFELIFPFI